jgi:hypothetical protein
MLDTIKTTTTPGATPDDAIDLNYADSSRLMKRVLTKAFPGTKFGVRLSSGTGYGNCYLRWTDGPTVTEVAQITSAFEGQGFDGWTDMAYSMRTKIMYDAQRKQWVRPRLRMILEQRDRSAES